MTFEKQPQFSINNSPGFILLVKALYMLIGSIPITFSVIGGVSLYAIIIYTCRIIKVPFFSLEGIVVSFILFFCPLIWINSNSFTPELLGTALVMASYNYLLTESHKRINIQIGWIVAGLLTGVKIQFFPLLLIPFVLLLIKRPKLWYYSSLMLAGIALWLVPAMLVSFDFPDLSFYGDLVSIHEVSIPRFLTLITLVWTDLLTGFYPDRNPLTIIVSIGTVLSLVFGVFIILDFRYPRRILLGIILSLILFFIYSFFLPDIEEQPRLLLPVFPFISIGIAYGLIFFLINYNYLAIKILVGLYLVCFAAMGIYLAWEHKKPTAVYQVKDHIKQQSFNPGTTIISHKPVIYFLKNHGIKAQWLSLEDDWEAIQALDGTAIIIIKEKQNMSGHVTGQDFVFSHLPYVNHFYPSLHLIQNF